MIDWHSHILPKMDDGSRNVDESISMLEEMKRQGVTAVIATPHFLANDDSVDSFLQRRSACYEALAQAVSEEHPRVLCGAEVKYYPGIARMQGLERLAIEGTNILLLEMPMAKWTEYTVNELIELAGTRGLVVMLAHIERYLSMQSKRTIERLCGGGLLMQVNASFFERASSRRKALKLFASGMVHFIGSDCHNMTTRAPCLAAAYEVIDKKFGGYYLSKMDEFGYRLLGDRLAR